MRLLKHPLASPRTVALVFLSLDLTLDLLLSVLKPQYFRVLLLDIAHDLPLHLCGSLKLQLGLPHLVAEIVGLAF